MSEHSVRVDDEHTTVDVVLEKVEKLREARPAVHADFVHPGIAAHVEDPQDASSPKANAALANDFDRA